MTDLTLPLRTLHPDQKQARRDNQAPSPKRGGAAQADMTDLLGLVHSVNLREAANGEMKRHALRAASKRFGRKFLTKIGYLNRKKLAALDNAEIIRQSVYFDAKWYLSQNPDVARAGADPALHYVQHGASEGREPGPFFNSHQYLANNPDVVKFGNPLLHYILHGVAEGRSFASKRARARAGATQISARSPEQGPSTPTWFDEDYYLSQLPMPIAMDAYSHFTTIGWSEGLNPHPLFDVTWFAENNPEVEQKGVQPILDYLTTKGGYFSQGHSSGYRAPGREPFKDFNDRAVFARLSEAKVLSLDIFDTAMVRRVSAPVAVFDMMEAEACRLSPRFVGLAKQRSEAERRARQISAEKTGRLEIGLQEIYDVLAQDLGLTREECATIQGMELDFERQILCANPRALNWYKEALDRGLKVIFVSDMYLPSNFLQEVLEAAGFENPKVYVSCEAGCGKWERRLYHQVADELKISPSQFLHIGDNFGADKAAADAAGWIGLHYEEGEDWHPFAMQMEERDSWEPSNLAACVSLGLARVRRLQICDTQYDENERLARLVGYELLGPMALAFADWIGEKSIAQKLDTVLFLARDGQLSHLAYERLRGSGRGFCESQYVLASRRLLYPHTFSTPEGVVAFVRKVNFGRDTTLAEYLDIFHLSDEQIAECARKLSIADPHKPLMKYGVEYEKLRRQIGDVIASQSQAISQNAVQHNDVLVDYYSEVVGTDKNKRLAVIDLGWSGTLVEPLLGILRSINPDVVVSANFFGLNDRHAEIIPPSVNTDAYFFKGDPWVEAEALLLPVTNGEVIGASPSLVETLFSENVSTAVSLERDDQGVIQAIRSPDTYSAEQRRFIELAHDEALKFVDDFIDVLGGESIQGDFKPLLRSAWARVLASPSFKEAKILGSFPHRVDASGHSATTTLAGHDHDCSANLIDEFRCSLWPAGWFAQLNSDQRSAFLQ